MEVGKEQVFFAAKDTKERFVVMQIGCKHMKITYLLLLIMLSLASCALFKKTNKSVSSQSSVKQTEVNQMLLKQANRETQIFTYWNDSGFYQIQNIKEKIDEAAVGEMKMKENQVNKARLVEKESQSLQLWLGVGGLVIGVAALIFFKAR